MCCVHPNIYIFVCIQTSLSLCLNAINYFRLIYKYVCVFIFLSLSLCLPVYKIYTTFSFRFKLNISIYLYFHSQSSFSHVLYTYTLYRHNNKTASSFSISHFFSKSQSPNKINKQTNITKQINTRFHFRVKIYANFCLAFKILSFFYLFTRFYYSFHCSFLPTTTKKHPH